MTVSVVIPAAGSSTRMGEGKKKEFLPLPPSLFPKEKKTTVLACTIQAFLVAFENSKDFTLKQISDYLINKIAKERNISKSLARKLFINAISYNLVVNAIDEQIDFLLGIEYEE